MPNYYVDIGTPNAWSTRDGQSSGACWYGATGLQKAFDTAAAGEIVYIRGLAAECSDNCKVFYTVTYDASSGTTLNDGEEVTWDTGEGAWADGTDKGIVRVAASTAGGSGTVEIDLTSGTMPADNDVIKGSTSGQTITRAATANAVKGIDVDATTMGTNAGGFIKYIGVNTSWAVDGTRAVIDMGTTAAHGITLAGTADLLWFENIEVRHAGTAKNNWQSVADYASGNVFINCCAHGGANVGFYMAGQYGCLFIRCIADNNTSHGFYFTNSMRALFCGAYKNAGSGIANINVNTNIIGCIFHDNTGDQVLTSAAGGGFVMNCVVDGGDDDGVVITAGSGLQTAHLIGNRITNNSASGKYGLNCNSEAVVLGWNYFEHNGTTHPDDNITGDSIVGNIPLENTTTNSNQEDQTDQYYGYAADNATAGDGSENFATGYVDGTDPTLRRTAITVPLS